MSVDGNNGQLMPKDTSMKETGDEQQVNRDQNLNEYLYGTLFKQQLFSDVTVKFLGKEWKLHKVIVQRCPYFASMFSGNWKESKEEVVEVKTEDSAVTEESVDAVFGSLYGGKVILTSENVISILASASLFIVQELIDQCTKFMIDNLEEAKPAIAYHNASETYGLPLLKTNVMQWLVLNLVLCSREEDYLFLQDISLELMKDIILNSNFNLHGHEYSLYRMLRKWYI